MKRSIVWIVLTAMSCFAFSQNLTPRIQQEGKDTFFCFNLAQCKIIAKQMENSLYCDSINRALENEINLLSRKTCNRDSSILLLQMKENNQCLITANQEVIIQTVNGRLKQMQKKYKWQLWQKRLCVIGIIVLSTTGIFKK